MRWFIALLASVTMLPSSFAQTDLAHCKIITQSGATKTELYAASQLQDYLAKLTGNRPEISDQATGRNLIIVGQGPIAAKLCPSVTWSSLGQEQTFLRSVGSNLVVAGGRERGTLYAAYRLLQEKCGVRWWAPWAIQIPKRKHLRIKIDEWSETPAFEYREAYWSHTHGLDWALPNFANGASVNADPDHGGRITYQNFVHSYYVLVPPEKYFATRPQWFSLINGKRTADNAQLCTTNPELRDFIVQRVRAELRANPMARITSISQNDCFNPCQCDECRALVKREGSEAALVLDLANYVAAEIKDEFPQVAVDTLAYQWSRHPTLHMRPLPNVIVRLCSIECDFAKPLFAPVNQAFASDLTGWNKLTNRLYIWDYCTNFAQYLQPEPDYFALGPTLRWFSENGVKGVFEEGDYTSSGGDMAELKAWLIQQMLWNPKLNPDLLIDEFLRGYYGPAAKPIKAYLRLMTDAAQTTHVSFALGSNVKFLNYETASQAKRLWDQAIARTANDATFGPRVRVSSLSLDYVWLVHWNEYRNAAAKKHDRWPYPATVREAAEQWLAAVKGADLAGYPPVTAVDEGGRSPEQFVAGLLGG